MMENEHVNYETGEIIETPEIPEETETAVMLRSAGSELTITALSSLPETDAKRQIDTAIEMIRTIRKAAIKMTYPSDWVLYHDRKTERTFAYLQDTGCQRVRDIFGITIKPTKTETISGDDKDDFYVVITGDAHSRLTGQVLYGVEGIKTSDEILSNPAFAELTGAELKAQVRRHARANMDGRATRKLGGLNNVPIEALKEAGIDVDKCTKGRGFQRTNREAVQEVTGVVCPDCGAKVLYIKGGINKAGKAYREFWACANRDCNWKTWHNPQKAGE